ncbi:hypothetical protein EV144_106290 [Flavobacterium sp. 270]|uniref:hypothetical protein n=1 Tax=Flavobacterium sp. 270 TaxID=2512114 RepID=UPI0010665869|nr:hypothetical protein [Flavobacterium sp. 270]TDW46616.1 hypothetical protein EV144_106290 [Flavobacterium sp. 270]
MKNYIYCLFSLLFISCASQSEENQVINDFIKQQYTLDPYIRVVLDKANSRMQPLEYYEKAYQDRNIHLGDMKRITPNGYPPYNWPIDTAQSKILKEKYKNDTITYYWKKKDFYRPKFKIISMQELNSTSNAINKKFYNSTGLSFSKPVITTDYKYALIYYSVFIVGGHTGGKDETILMENINGKWKTIKTYSDPNVIN